MQLPRLVLTPGEPAGIGVDLAVQLAQSPPAAAIVCMADADVLLARAEQLRLPLKIVPYQPGKAAPMRAGELVCTDIRVAETVAPGRLNPGNAAYVLQTLECAANGCLRGEFDAMVTGPVQKSVLNDAGIPFTGHTEYLCSLSGVEHVVMMLVAGSLRVALVTTHVPLQSVAALITRQLVIDTVRKVQRALQDDWAIARPRILVAGLNPHAGEGGHLGREEIDQIIPAIEWLCGEGLLVTGPLPADTLFTPSHLQEADAVVAMYHDQGLPVLKHVGFGQAVNVTLGLPFVRTSVDHGTALDLVGTGRADPGSLQAALAQAAHMAGNRQRARQGAGPGMPS